MTPVAISPLNLIEGQPFFASMLFRSKTDGPVNFAQQVHGAAWSGRASFARETPARESETLLTVPLTLKASGRVLMDLSADQVALLTGPHIICQINLDAPHPDFNEVWRANVIVQ